MRIISGRFGGRALKAPRGLDTRPTTDRVREALFSILGDAVEGVRVADLFAGTGALGLEALSRGAARVDFFEAGRDARRVLEGNVAALGVGALVTLHGGKLPGALEAVQAGEPWELVFMDPPWDKGLGLATAGRLVARGLLAPGALVVSEERAGGEGDDAAWAAAGLTVVDRRRYGDTALVLSEAPR